VTGRTADAARFWDQLHTQRRFRPAYPSEHVVRFVRSLPDEGGRARRALDIGCGGGRHTVLLAESGFAVDAVDISEEGLAHTRATLHAAGLDATLGVASMTSLPFGADTFDAAVSFGVFYYGTADEGRAAVSELHRVLRPGGRAFVVVRTRDDYRYGKGEEIEPGTFLIDADDTNERDTVQSFLGEDEVAERFAAFSELSFELTETSFGGRTGKNSDWLVSATK
jgi:SAM-dependent methyltransferase